MNRFGFTLAEVLITLGIIGVVAALTIPTLMQKTNRKETVAKVKKVVSTMSNALEMSMAEYGLVSKWNLKKDASSEDANYIAERLKPYLNVVKDCGVDKTGCIYNGTYKDLQDRNQGNYQANTGYYKLLLNDNIAVMFKSDPGGARIYCIADINGEKGPNKLGYDTFYFYIDSKDKFLTHNVGAGSICDIHSGTGTDCSTYIMQHDNMDYLDE